MKAECEAAGGGEIEDALERARALDVTRSFIVQAPAGSGKTGLLVQRFLALLARVERPEAVLAITFTRKAAAEMRRRILDALLDARSRSEAPASAFDRKRFELARAVLARDAELGWGLLHSPSRLQVFTIDGFCSRVVAGTPLLSRLGSTPAVVEQADVLYREAVRRTLAPSGRALLGEQLEILLERYEMGMDRLEGQLIDMLARRDQWRDGAMRCGRDETSWVAEVEVAFAAALSAEITSLAADAEPALVSRIHDIARRSRDAVGDGCLWPTLGAADCLGTGASAARAWIQAAALLTKDEGKRLRTPRTRNDDVHGADAALKTDVHRLLEDLASLPPVVASRWAEGLQAASRLPAAAVFNDDGRRALGAFLAVLRHCYAALWDVFRHRREVDYVEIAMSAVAALAPGETLEKLDARLEHILVDEFQDTNVLQCDLLRGLTSGWQDADGRTLFLVGDPMQSIYRFRKAEVGLFLAARSSPGFLENCRLSPVALSVNFRSTPIVVEWVNRTFSVLLGDRDDATRSLVAFAPASPAPGAGGGAAVEFVLWSSDAAGNAGQADAAEGCGLADWIAGQLRERHDPAAGGDGDAGQHAAPIAVLVRARSHALPLLRALESRAPHVRVRAPGLDMLADRICVLDLEALTRALLHPGDRLSWLALLRSPWIGLTLDDLARLVEVDVAAAASPRLATAVPLLLRDATALARVSDDARRRIARLLSIMDAARRDLPSRSIDVVVRSAWLRLGGPACEPALARLVALDAEAFFDLLAARARGGCVDLDDLSRALAVTEATVDADAAADVEIMTMHKAKGLEWDTVIVPALGRASGRSSKLPLAMETEPDTGQLTLVAPRGARGREDADSDKYEFLQHREARRSDAETLRLLYVAATRARRQLLLSAAHGRLNKDGSPSAGSLLKALAPALDVAAARVEVVDAAGAAARRTMTRFPAAFLLARAPVSVEDRSVTSERPSALGEVTPAFFAEDRTAAHVGTVYHAFVQRIAVDGPDAWTARRVDAERPAIAHALRTAGVLAREMETSVARVAALLLVTVEDERGRWILSAHEHARSEWAMLSYRDRKLTSAVLDRSFVADGAHWIIDFKTGTFDPGAAVHAAMPVQTPVRDSAAASAPQPAPATEPPAQAAFAFAEIGDRYGFPKSVPVPDFPQADVQRWIVEKCGQHAFQLARYRDLLRGSVAADGATARLPVRLALFFPEWPQGQRWQEITALADDLA